MKLKLTSRLTPSWVIYIIDIFINLVSIILAYLLRFNFRIPTEFSIYLFPIVIAVITIKSLVLYFGRTHVYIIRYTSIRDLVKLIYVSFIASSILAILNVSTHLILKVEIPIPNSVLIIDFICAAYAMVSLRMLVKLVFFEFRSNISTTEKANALLYGTEELAVSVKRALDIDSEALYRIAAFVDNSKEMTKKKLEGLDIYNVKRLESVIKHFHVKYLLFAKPDMPTMLKSIIVEKCLNMHVKVLSVQNVSSWLKGNVDVRQIRNIRIEDLLERDTINLDTTQIQKQHTNKTILVTGAGGSIGSEIVRQICQYNPLKIILLDQAETPLHNIEIEIAAKSYSCKIEIVLGDITNANKMRKLFETHNIDIVYHAAAYKHVPMMEHHPLEAVKNNVLGSKVLSDMAVRFKVPRFVMISTDKAVNPTNVMGASKRIAEIYTQSLNEFGVTNFITTRFGNVLGSNGSVIPLFQKQIEEGGPVTVTDPEVTRYFMTIPEACQLVLEASTIGKGGEIFIFDMGKSVRVTDLAKNMIKLAGLTPGKDIEIKYVGLRPGEKLYEELLAKDENTIATHHPKILIAKVKSYNFEDISTRINQLIQLVETADNMQIVAAMKDIVPEFRSHNSSFKALDVEKKFRSHINVIK